MEDYELWEGTSTSTQHYERPNSTATETWGKQLGPSWPKISSSKWCIMAGSCPTRGACLPAIKRDKQHNFVVSVLPEEEENFFESIKRVNAEEDEVNSLSSSQLPEESNERNFGVQN